MRWEHRRDGLGGDPADCPRGRSVRAPLIAVAGNINADLVYALPRPPLPGETLLAEDLRLGPGGKAANAAVALARLGAEPRLIGCVGEDPLGSLVLDALRREGVATDRIVRGADALTGVASVFVAPEGENAIVTHLGANLRMSPRELPGLEGCGALLMTLGLPRDVLLALLVRARETGAMIVLDATPLRGDPLPAELLEVDVLSANRVEAQELTGRSIPSSSREDALHACADLQALGAKAAVLKLGEEGAVWTRGGGGGDHGFASAPAVQAIDTTGAGDAFMAGLTLRLVQGAGLPEAVEFACRIGALSTTGRGAQGGVVR
jgi:ribokinase